jgi:hypothetical protein
LQKIIPEVLSPDSQLLGLVPDATGGAKGAPLSPLDLLAAFSPVSVFSGKSLPPPTDEHSPTPMVTGRRPINIYCICLNARLHIRLRKFQPSTVSVIVPNQHSFTVIAEGN